MGAVNIDFQGRDGVNRVVEELNRRLDKMETSMTTISQSSATMGNQVASSVQNIALQWFGVQQAVSQAVQAVEVYDRNLREAGNSTTALAEATVAFLDLQEHGLGRLRREQVLQMGAAGGLDTREQLNELVALVAALQSARGDFQAGLSSAQVALQASQLGIPIGAAGEAERLGPGLGAAPGQILAQAYVAGIMSAARDPGVVIGAAPAFPRFESSAMGAAAAGVIAGVVSAPQVQAFTGRAGIGLASQGAVDEYLKSQNVVANTQADRIRGLARLGLDTEEELQTVVGMAEVRERTGVAALVRNIGQFERIYAAAQEADPEVFARRRQELEAEDPALRLARETAASRGRTLIAQTADIPAAQRNLRRQQEAERLRATGGEQFLGTDLITSEGELTTGLWATLLRAVLPENRMAKVMRQGLADGVNDAGGTGIATPEAD